MTARAYDDEYATCERADAKLLIYCGDRSPAWVTTLLGLTPTLSREKGELVPGRRQPAPLNLWALSSEGVVDSRDLRRHIDWLIAQLEPAAEALKVVQNEPGVTMNVTCVWWSAHGHGGPMLWPDQLGRLGQWNLELSFDIYFFEDDDEASLPIGSVAPKTWKKQ